MDISKEHNISNGRIPYVNTGLTNIWDCEDCSVAGWRDRKANVPISAPSSSFHDKLLQLGNAEATIELDFSKHATVELVGTFSWNNSWSQKTLCTLDDKNGIHSIGLGVSISNAAYYFMNSADMSWWEYIGYMTDVLATFVLSFNEEVGCTTVITDTFTATKRVNYTPSTPSTIRIGSSAIDCKAVYGIRVYDEFLTSEQLSFNRAIDKERFGV